MIYDAFLYYFGYQLIIIKKNSNCLALIKIEDFLFLPRRNRGHGGKKLAFG